MRLIDTKTWEIREFDADIQPYAILSHTWGKEEVKLAEFEEAVKDSSHPARKKEGFRKVVGACRQAADMGLGYVWVDTCCIDKTSSAELSEAINSMYNWYSRGRVCLVYLSDLDSSPAWRERLARCRWFARGWCLQEMIAPRDLRFFDRNWVPIGAKHEISWLSQLSHITRVPEPVLADPGAVRSCSVALKFSWAATRNTTREEDRAYSLMGLFDVNMPMLYGEGPKAFARLQEEIIKKSRDRTIFGWIRPTAEAPSRDSQPPQPSKRIKTSRGTFSICDMLSPSLSWFASAGDWASTKTMHDSFVAAPLLGHDGVSFATSQVFYFPNPSEGRQSNFYWLPLTSTKHDAVRMSIPVLQTGRGLFVRADAEPLHGQGLSHVHWRSPMSMIIQHESLMADGGTYRGWPVTFGTSPFSSSPPLPASRWSPRGAWSPLYCEILPFSGVSTSTTDLVSNDGGIVVFAIVRLSGDHCVMAIETRSRAAISWIISSEIWAKTCADNTISADDQGRISEALRRVKRTIAGSRHASDIKRIGTRGSGAWYRWTLPVRGGDPVVLEQRTPQAALEYPHIRILRCPTQRHSDDGELQFEHGVGDPGFLGDAPAATFPINRA